MNPQTKKHNLAMLLPVLLACGGALLAWAWLMGGAVWHRLIFLMGQDAKMDFFNCIVECSTLRVYEVYGSIYPPLGNLMFYALSKLLPSGMNARVMSESAAGEAVYFVYTAVTLLALAALVAKLAGGSRMRQFAAGALCLVTEPVIYAVERGNIVLWAAVFCAAFLLWYRSASRRLREAALVCLALAANLKIYPAVLGILLLTDKTCGFEDAKTGERKKLGTSLHALVPRWKDALRCALYGAVLFFVPFAFMGGAPALLAMLGSIVGTSKKFFENGFAYKIEFRNTLGILNTLAFGENGFPAQWMRTGARVISLTGAVCFPFLKGHWRKAAMLCALLIGIPGFSYQYNFVFMLPAAALFFHEAHAQFEAKDAGDSARREDVSRGMTMVYAVLFAAMLLPLPFAANALLQTDALRSVSLTVAVSGTALLLTPLVLAAETICKACKRDDSGFIYDENRNIP